MIFLQHKGLDCGYGSRNVRLALVLAPFREAPLTRCFIGGQVSGRGTTQGVSTPLISAPDLYTAGVPLGALAFVSYT